MTFKKFASLSSALFLFGFATTSSAGPPIMIQGVLGVYGTCKPHASSWTPSWANLVLLYHFDEVGGSATCADSSAVGNSAACVGFVSSTAKMSNGLVTGTGSYMYETTQFTNPQIFSVSAWFKTSTTTGGGIIGFSDTQTGTANAWDRHVYMAANGRIFASVYDGNIQTVSSPLSYNDGNWHHVAFTFTSGSMILYIDGASVASTTSVGSAQGYNGYWHVGYNYLSLWHSEPTTYILNGMLDDAAVFSSILSPSDVSTIYTNGALTSSSPQWSNVQALWRFDEANGATVADSSGHGVAGTLTTATVRPAGKFGNAMVASVQTEADSSIQQTNPTTFTTTTWFKTSSTTGGGIFQFIGQQSGTPSGNYDRGAYMRNDGRITFGTYSGSIDTITTTAAYNDDRWHHIAGVLVGGTTLKLYMDGKLIGTQATNQSGFNGWWRFGYSYLSGWPSQPTSTNLPGTFDEAAVWNVELTAAQIRSIYENQSCGKN